MLDPKSRRPALNSAIELLHFAYRTMIGEPDRLLARRGLGRLHHRILYFVARSPGASVGDLTRTLGVSKQALNAPLRLLVEQGLVAWKRSPADQRVKRLDLTGAGRTLEARLSALQRAQFAAAFDAAGPQAEEGWRRTMRAFAMAEMRKAGRWVDPPDAAQQVAAGLPAGDAGDAPADPASADPAPADPAPADPASAGPAD